MTALRLGTNAVYPFRLAEGGVALVDAGPDFEGSFDDLGGQLRRVGLARHEVRLVIVTHAHADHAGLAARWAAEGARVVCGAADAAALRAGAEGYAASRQAREAELRRHGCPESVLDAIASRPRAALAWPGTPAVETVDSGSTFPLVDGRRLRVIEAPGHTPGNVVVAIEGEGADGACELCSGDTLLPDTIPTPGLHFAAGDPESSRWPSLPPFIDSVRRLGELDVIRVWPGHGGLVAGEDVPRLGARFLAHHERRAGRARAALEGGPRTAFEVARALFPRLPAARFGQALTEVIGHFDVLEAAGRGVLEAGSAGVMAMRLRVS